MNGEELDPARGVPDALYEELHWAPETLEETYAGRVLRIHRDWLNGGFEQTFNNLEAFEEPADIYAEAYLEVGLPTAAKLLTEASVAHSTGELSEGSWDLLDERYERLTYGSATDTTDAIEAAVVRYIQQNAQAFSSAFARADR
jgi:hypothetical protein